MKSISQQLSGPATKKRGDSGRTEDYANKCKIKLIKLIFLIKVVERLINSPPH